MALLLVRHGSTALNAGDPADPKDYFRGWIDTPLSDYGVKTMQKTAQWLSQFPIARVISSDLPRASQSAQMIGQAVGKQVELDPRLRSMNIGALTGKLITPENKRIVEQAHENPAQQLPGGESYGDFLNRYKGILPELLAAGQKQNIAVVTHHRNLLALPHLFFGQAPKVTDDSIPGSVVVLGRKGVHVAFSPPGEEAEYKEHAQS
jgi:broad specificity phosphatase PhoE